ncbi:TPA: 5-(carboxyamino)imidazole ribonucleotide mutase [Candidatus Daviesbacteria bacterium]|uniref:N5-carboxyaminoimidazole ribonucleotide mutase n=1 Tax=Candidatus Daviesbacteria bacterium GW2011_GWF2_38_6 TaxID=1618432 RepID=A0A0G0MYZ6_9BACT|nr:MAG: N5-carboxyaminoimidazole ribonucleotide mutase [Candidatus Daviesbacteria bacterium GW2011_GWF2_38_6]OGE27526.1 MAG: 5-(carboxyamino)imidazole ribonucleotide mutase [Candidatus Daviesbacteria bacterium RIFCSPHIGHO2_02_FULL_39_41]OGE44074.1 MAG: 5-(carboxyamino)imidazole ribonucleotide mutase [Candidatus Daviesbacteria bacterium RIFCSPHIGHO2_12_FULL_38_25]OGE68259.1 MAG: 5-(carboxyamino)imidazole ribonucleotide mutase [Candidatus Daviesbacteria bacterium RIFCSPLOWO2_02_FULL_38_18]OGE7225
MTKVLIISASESDLPVMEGAAKVLEEFGVEHEMAVSSAHRSPDRTVELVKKFHEEGGKVIIAGAGLAAHLAGAVAARFPLPVIGVPLSSGALEGIDALLATMQMPPGVPVATVAINGAKNAGFLAVQILATSDSSLEKKLIDYKQKLAL